jgi:hypothetical protein
MTVTHNGVASAGATSPSTYTVNCNVTTGTPGYSSNPAAGSTLSINATQGATSGNTTTMTVTETGTAQLSITGVTFSGTDAGKFSANPTTFSVADGASGQVVTVTCNTSTAGTFTASMNVTHNATGSPASYPVNCTITSTAAGYGSTPANGSTLSISTNIGATSNNTTTLTISETGNATLNVTAASITGTNANKFSLDPAFSAFSIADGGSSRTLTIKCDTSQAGSFTGTLSITHNASANAATYPLSCSVSSTPAPTNTPGPGTPGSGATVAPSGITQCPANQNFSKPFPQNASGEFLLVNCFLVTGPGSINMALTQVLTNPQAGVTAQNATTIQSNPGLMSVWRMGSWFLVPSTYNAATATYTFDAISGTQIYAFFYGAITQPVGSQGTGSTTTTGSGSGAGTETGGVPGEDFPIEQPQPEENGIDPRAVLISTGITLLGALAVFYFLDSRKKARRKSG